MGHPGGTERGSAFADAGAEPGGRRIDFLKRDLIANTIVVLVIIVAMQLWSEVAPPYIMPAPRISGEAILNALGGDYFQILITVTRLVVAVLFSLVVGSALGALMALVRPLKPFLKSIIFIDTGVPALSWMLFAIFWFKAAEARVFFILAMVLLPFYALNVADGIGALSRDLVEMAETFRPTRWQLFRLLILPHTVPYILMTTRSIIGYAIRMTVFAELLSVSTGIGARMGLAQSNFQMEGVIAWTVILVVLNLLIQALVAALEKSLLRWRPEVTVR